MQLEFRFFQPSDRAACLAIFESNIPDFFLPHERGEFVTFLEEPLGAFLVAESPDGIVGCGGYILGDDGVSADLCWGMIARELQGRGFGSALLAHRVQMLRGFSTIRTLRMHTSPSAAGFYERHGFRIARVLPGGLGDGVDQVDLTLELA